MRASGVRSSWLQLASSRRWAATSSSMRSAERLKLAASAATSSRPSTFTRAPRSPPPSCSTPSLQPLEPPAEPAHHGIGADRDGEREHSEAAHDPQDRARPLAHLACHQPAAVGKLQGEGRAARAAPPAVARAPRIEARRRPAGHGDLAAVAAVEGEVEAQLAMQRIERPLAARPAARRPRAAGRRSARRRRRDIAASGPRRASRQRRRADEHRQHQQDGDVELEIEALHVSVGLRWERASDGAQCS